MYRRENQRQYELRADTVSECKSWIDAIKLARSVVECQDISVSGRVLHSHWSRNVEALL